MSLTRGNELVPFFQHLGRLRRWLDRWLEHERWMVILPRVILLLFCVEMCLLAMGVFWM